MDELKPCPFCGGKPTLMFNSVVECRHCPNGKYSGYPSADITAWNTRAASGGDSASLEQRARELFDSMMGAAYGGSTIGNIVCAETTRGRLEAAWLPLITAALANQQGVGGWQPIESAPKDGTLYLCWVDAIRYGERDDGQVDTADVSAVDFGEWRNFETGGAHINMMGDIGDGQKITHWMPLPAAPTQPAGDVGREG